MSKSMGKALGIFKNRKPFVVGGMVLDKLFNKRLKGFNQIASFFENKTGIEIGGPSVFFSDSGYIPVYALAKKIDGCNFSNQTIWEGNIEEGETYLYAPGKQGHQFICEGSEVAAIPKERYDFLLSCNNLEHIANPLKAVENWLKLLSNEGVMVLVLPRKESNFDHKRNVTPFEHLLSDLKNNMDEDDFTHLEEILKLHDLNLDPPAGTFEDFKRRSLNNFSNRSLHHHVYNLKSLERICEFFHLKILATANTTTDYVIVAQKVLQTNPLL